MRGKVRVRTCLWGMGVARAHGTQFENARKLLSYIIPYASNSGLCHRNPGTVQSKYVPCRLNPWMGWKQTSKVKENGTFIDSNSKVSILPHPQRAHLVLSCMMWKACVSKLFIALTCLALQNDPVWVPGLFQVVLGVCGVGWGWFLDWALVPVWSPAWVPGLKFDRYLGLLSLFLAIFCCWGYQLRK